MILKIGEAKKFIFTRIFFIVITVSIVNEKKSAPDYELGFNYNINNMLILKKKVVSVMRLNLFLEFDSFFKLKF